MTTTATTSTNYSSMGCARTTDFVDNFYNNDVYGDTGSRWHKETETAKKGNAWGNFFKVIALMAILFIAGAIATLVILVLAAKVLIDLFLPLVGPIITGAITIVVVTFLLAVALIIKILIPFI